MKYSEVEKYFKDNASYNSEVIDLNGLLSVSIDGCEVSFFSYSDLVEVIYKETEPEKDNFSHMEVTMVIERKFTFKLSDLSSISVIKDMINEINKI